MRINHKVLSIPPYISTSWKQIVSIHSDENDGKTLLVLHLQDGSSVSIPDLDLEIIKVIFNTHSKYVEQEAQSSAAMISIPAQTNALAGSFPIEMDVIQSMLYHKEEERYSQNLPPYLLKKVAEFSQEMGFSDSHTLPTPEAHCNCPHCQIARTMRQALKVSPDSPCEEEEEEDITSEDLSFKSWIIEPVSQDLYKVTHPDDPKQTFQVFLSSPIGCTCGSNRCEHIEAVLNS
jgi:hypothetical protein